MKKGVCGALCSWFLLAGAAQAAWVDVSQRLNETDIRRLAAHPGSPGLLMAASERRVYVTQDAGVGWKQVLGVRATDRINGIFFDPARAGVLYAATDRELKRSLDAGKHWKSVFTVPSESGAAVLTVAAHRGFPDRLYVGTTRGLYIVDASAGRSVRVPDISAVGVGSVLMAEDEPSRLWAATDKGIYRSEDQGARWHLEMPFMPDQEAESTPLEQFSIEEMPLARESSQLAWSPGARSVLAATPRGLFEADPKDRYWRKADGQNLPDKKINALVPAAETFYVGTDQGVFEWDQKSRHFTPVVDGLAVKETRALAYDRSSSTLYAATSSGVYRLSYPERTVTPVPIDAPARFNWGKIEASFRHEPAVGAVQAWAVEYAEVHPDKIKQWRQAAARKAWLPTLSMGSSVSDDQNIDLDRGGTNDPDRFIEGPSEKSADWNVDVSWDLSELVWNNDQTSIDSRSRLLVELRQDILNEVTHLYFERRRLKAQILMSPVVDAAVGIDRQIRLEELEAGLDGLTGGRFTREIAGKNAGPR